MSTNQHSTSVEDSNEISDGFTVCDLKAILDNANAQSYTAISEALHVAASEAKDDGDLSKGKALRLLGYACSMTLSPDKSSEPFGPCFEVPGERSAVPDDFTEDDIDFFANVVNFVDHVSLKARLSDLIWTTDRKRGIKYALSAIDSYMEIPLDPATWRREGERCWQRAIDLSRMIGKAAGDRTERIETSIIDALNSATVKNGIFGHNLAHILLTSKLVENHPVIVAEKLKSLARDFDIEHNFLTSEIYYHAAAKWFNICEDDEQSVDMTAAQAASFENEADAKLKTDNPNYGVAAGFLEDALQVYRSIPRANRSRNNVDEKINALELRINKFGQRALENMMTINGSTINLSQEIEQAQLAVSGKPFLEALLAFANLHNVNAKELRDAAVESLSNGSFLAHIPKVVTSHDGRVIARTPGVRGSSASEEDELEIRSQMNRFHYQPLVSMVVQGLILPALHVLNLEHHVRQADLINIARRSPIVPIGREILFGKALYQGFNLDFVTSIHLLSPQIEHTMRIHLKSFGVSTTHFDENGIETETGLSSLMDHPEIVDIFGEDLSYEIKALYCDQIGPNLRNNISHGLLDDQQCHSIDAVYAWWLALKMVTNTYWNSNHRVPVS